MYSFEAVETLNKAIIRRWPNSLEANCGPARLEMRRGELELALREWHYAIEKFPEEYEPLLGKAYCLFDLGEQALVSQKLTKKHVFLKRSKIAKIRPNAPKIIDLGSFENIFWH